MELKHLMNFFLLFAQDSLYITFQRSKRPLDMEIINIPFNLSKTETPKE